MNQAPFQSKSGRRPVLLHLSLGNALLQHILQTMRKDCLVDRHPLVESGVEVGEPVEKECCNVPSKKALVGVVLCAVVLVEQVVDGWIC